MPNTHFRISRSSSCQVQAKQASTGASSSRSLSRARFHRYYPNDLEAQNSLILLKLLTMMFRSLFSFRSSSRSPSPVSTSSTRPTSDFSSRRSSPFSVSDSRSKPLPLPPDADLDFSAPDSFAVSLPGGHLPVPTSSHAVSTAETMLLPKNKISSHRLHQLTILVTVLNLTKMSLQGEQDTMVSILQAATTSTAAKLRTPSPDSQDIDLLALAANACRVRRYRAEEPTGSTAVGPWQVVVDEVGIAIRRLEAEVEGLQRERRVLEDSW